MKYIFLSMLLISGIGISHTYAQKEDKAETKGQNFSLEGALDLFKKSKSLEEFEKFLNQEDNNVNNLDLNNDGQTDYIVVQDIQDQETHVIVLSTYINEKDKQDIATIGIEKTGKEEAILQIEGDEDLYATNTIVEPFEEEQKSNKRGPNISDIQLIRVNVWFWPSVQFVYAPSYRVWVSPYRWGYYPMWWKPWRPWGHPVFYTRTAPYRVYYRPALVRRVVVARRVYAPRRSTTVVIHKPHGKTVIHTNRRGKTTVVKTRRGRRR